MQGMSPPDGRLSRKAQLHRTRIAGAGAQPLVLLHGFGTDQDAWQHVLPGLLPDFRVVLLDLAGAGPNSAETFDAARYADLESHADDLLAILDELEIRDAFLVGASMGGMIGILAAIEQPAMFQRLVLLGASPRYLDDAGYQGGFDQAALDGIYAAMSGDYQAWVSGFAPVAVRRPPEDSAAREFAASLFALRPDIALSTARTVFQSDLRDRLKLLRRPARILQMRNDVAVPVAVGTYLSQQLPQAEMEILPAEGHLPHLSAPAVVGAALQRHLA